MGLAAWNKRDLNWFDSNQFKSRLFQAARPMQHKYMKISKQTFSILVISKLVITFSKLFIKCRLSFSSQRFESRLRSTLNKADNFKRSKVKGLDIYIPPITLTDQQRFTIWRGVLTGNDTRWRSASSKSAAITDPPMPAALWSMNMWMWWGVIGGMMDHGGAIG